MRWVLLLLLPVSAWAQVYDVVSTDDADVAAALGTYSTSSSLDHKACYWKFNAPSMPGAVSEARMYVSISNSIGVGSIATTVSGGGDLTWDGASSAATLSALSLTATDSLNVATGATGYISWDVTEAVVAAYAGGTPSTITVKATSPYGSETTVGGTNFGTFLFPSTGPYVTFDEVTDLPYLEITYEAYPGPCSAPLGTVFAPDSGSSWCIGSTKAVTWTNGASAAEVIKIYLEGDASGPILLATTAYPDTTENITVPDVPSGGGYRIAIEASCPGAYDIGVGESIHSDLFSIVDCSTPETVTCRYVVEKLSQTDTGLYDHYELFADNNPGGQDDNTGALFWKFSWPSYIPWSSVISVKLYQNPVQLIGASDYTIDAYYCAQDLGWGNSSSVSTMNGLSMGSSLGSATIDNLGASAWGYGYEGEFILDVASASITGTPSNITIKAVKSSGGTTSNGHRFKFGVWEAQFINYSPTLVIEYTCPADGGFAGADF